MLYIVDEVFFVGTPAKSLPSVPSITSSWQGVADRSPRSSRKEFFAITSGSKPDRHNWAHSGKRLPSVPQQRIAATPMSGCGSRFVMEPAASLGIRARLLRPYKDATANRSRRLCALAAPDGSVLPE